MTPTTFARACRLAPMLNERLSAEAIDAIRRIIEDPEKDGHAKIFLKFQNPPNCVLFTIWSVSTNPK